jgi:hypothetical protein
MSFFQHPHRTMTPSSKAFRSHNIMNSEVVAHGLRPTHPQLIRVGEAPAPRARGLPHHALRIRHGGLHALAAAQTPEASAHGGKGLD